MAYGGDFRESGVSVLGVRGDPLGRLDVIELMGGKRLALTDCVFVDAGKLDRERQQTGVGQAIPRPPKAGLGKGLVVGVAVEFGQLDESSDGADEKGLVLS